MTQTERKEKDVPETIAFSALILEVLMEEEQVPSAVWKQGQPALHSQLAGWSWTCRISSRL